MKRRHASPTAFRPTRHAVERYITRFAGNLTPTAAGKRLERIGRGAQRKRHAPGGATVYRSGNVEMVVVKGQIVTVYRPDTRPPSYGLES